MWNMFKLNKNTRDDVNEAGLVIFLLTLNKYMLAYAYHKKKKYPWFNHNYANNRIYRIVACYSIKKHNHFSIYDILLI